MMNSDLTICRIPASKSAGSIEQIDWYHFCSRSAFTNRQLRDHYLVILEQERIPFCRRFILGRCLAELQSSFCEQPTKII
ncbi:unnamed protein product [Cylindrotheca closterium]|uniref:Uncharacterized protein n=1 Tax=Cylindrotheca closterium TaxID=2856 RepID=A0AAD2CQP7_9STRA|nr:unnamed protein product [Cylindrotheca closterium]